MTIDCLHGFFIIREDQPGEAAQFMSYFGLNLVGFQDFFTFEGLALAPTYSIKGAPLLGQTATANFSGKPWEVFEANGMVFDLISGSLKPIASITTQVKISQAGFYFYSEGLLNPGSLRTDGERVKSYRAHLLKGTWGFRYSEVDYV